MEIKEKALSIVEVAAKTALSVIPVGGALVTAVYDSVKGHCLDKRQKTWQASLENRLAVIEKTLEEIGENELFTTALVKSTEIAMRTAREEKMAYLANAVVNSLDEELDLDEEKLILFLSLLDKYTISHIRTIFFFYNPTRFEQISKHEYMRAMGTPTDPLFRVYPELDTPLFSKIYNDLYIDGMVNTQSLNVMMSGSGMIAKRTTPLGDEFLKFILNSDQK